MKRNNNIRILLICFLVLLCAYSSAKNKKIATIPFQYVGGFIIVETTINNSSPLKFILDSGLRYTLITELYGEDFIEMNIINTSYLNGLGIKNSLEVLTSNFNEIKIDGFFVDNQIVYTVTDDAINLTSYLGQKVNGVLSMGIFYDYIIDVNYSTRKIILYEKEGYEVPKKYDPVRFEIQQHKMYIPVLVIEKDQKKEVRMLFDTGAGISAWLQTMKNNSFEIPKKNIYGYIGEGLSGEIMGKIAKIDMLKIGKYTIENPIIAFPDSNAINMSLFRKDRDGSIGIQILKRFNYIIDYSKNLLYIYPNRYLKDPFTYNISGIEIIQNFDPIYKYEVINVREDSEAADSGIQEGDILIEINNQSALFYNIDEVKNILETPTHQGLKLLMKVADKDSTYSVDIKMDKIL